MPDVSRLVSAKQSQQPSLHASGGTNLKQALLCAASVFAASLAVYAWTLAPAVTLVDSGELITTSHFLGVAHPPGFPLYVLLAHLASLAPWSTVAVRVNFASGVFGALASAMLTLVVFELMLMVSRLTATKGRATNRKGKAGVRPAVAEGTSPTEFRLLVLAPALGAGLLYAFSRTLWAYATIAEVYTLNTLLILGICFLMLRWRRGVVTGGAGEARTDRHLYLAALLFGLGLGVHHLTLALTLPAVAVLSYRTAGGRLFMSRTIVYAALVSIAGLIAIYSYLPLAAGGDAILKWGAPRSLQEIWWHITGRQYQSFFSFAPESLAQQFVAFLGLVARQFGPWWFPAALALAVAGVGYVFRRDRTAFWFLALIVLANLAYALGYDIAEDKDAYYLPTFVSLGMAVGFGIRALLELALSRGWWGRDVQVLAAAALVALPAFALASNWRFNNRRHYFIAQDYVENIQSTIERDGLLLTLDWQVQAPMFYTREIEQRRPDIKVVDINLLRRSWYYDYLRRAYPGLIERSGEKIDRFVMELRKWEQNPAAFEKDARLQRGIELAYQAMLQSLVAEESRIGGVYLTSDVMFLSDGSEKRFVNWLLKNYAPTPRGLVFRLMFGAGFHDPGEIRLQTRGLSDGTIRFERGDVVTEKVLPAYARMLFERGRYLAFHGQAERASRAFEQTLALDPKHEAAKQSLARTRGPVRPPTP